MQEFVAYIVKNLVDCRDRVAIHQTENDQGLLIELSVEQADVGKVIGKRGRTIRAIRTLLTSVASRHGLRVNLEILEEGRPVSNPEDSEVLEDSRELHAISPSSSAGNPDIQDQELSSAPV